MGQSWICDNDDKLQEVFAWASGAREVVVDIETTGLNTRKDAIVGIGLSDGYFTTYVVCRKYSSASSYQTIIRHEDIIKLFTCLIGKKIIAHNATFDLLFIKHFYGVNLVPDLHCDTILLSHICNENRFSYRLKDLGASLFGADVLAEQVEMKESVKRNGGTADQFFMADTEVLAKYCKQDCLLTYKLYRHFSTILAKEDLVQFFYNDETMPLYKYVTIPMVERGVRLDIPLISKTKQEIEEDIGNISRRIQESISPLLKDVFEPWYVNKEFPPSRKGEFIQEFCELYKLPLPRTKSGAYSLVATAVSLLKNEHARRVIEGTELMTKEEITEIQKSLLSKLNEPYIFNLSSKHHLKKLFFDTLKEKPLSLTPTGQPQADEDFLVAMSFKYDWCKDLITYNKLQKIKGTYIERFLDRAQGDRYYPRWEQHGTVTGRFSGDLQQLPRPLDGGDAAPEVLKYTNLIRNFIISDVGGVLIDADYESLEPHIFSHISGESALLNIFRSGLDFYSEICIKTEKIEGASADKKQDNYLGKINKAKRQSAKAYALGIAYGEEDWKLHIELGISQDEAKKLVKGYWDGFPNLKKISDTNKDIIMKKGIVKTEFGRIRRLPEARTIFNQHGSGILDSLQLWKDYNDTPAVYEQMKKKRKVLKKCLNAALNYPTQGAAASIVNRAAIATAKAYQEEGIQAVIVANIHDELLVSATLEHSEKAASILQSCMENTTKISLPLKAVPSIGTVYGEIK